MTYLGRMPSGSRAPDPEEVVDTILLQADALTIDGLTALGAAASAKLGQLDAELRRAGSPELAAKIKAWSRAERELRRRVRRCRASDDQDRVGPRRI